MYTKSLFSVSVDLFPGQINRLNLWLRLSCPHTDTPNTQPHWYLKEGSSFMSKMCVTVETTPPGNVFWFETIYFVITHYHYFPHRQRILEKRAMCCIYSARCLLQVMRDVFEVQWDSGWRHIWMLHTSKFPKFLEVATSADDKKHHNNTSKLNKQIQHVTGTVTK